MLLNEEMTLTMMMTEKHDKAGLKQRDTECQLERENFMDSNTVIVITNQIYKLLLIIILVK